VARLSPSRPLQAAADHLVAALYPEGPDGDAGDADEPAAGTNASVAAGEAPADLFLHPLLVHPRPPPPPKVPLYARPWPWIGAAAVAAGVIVGLVLWPRPQAITTVGVTPSDFALRLPIR
jgi:hypothetical protein